MGCIVRKQKNVLSANIKTISSVMFSTSQRNSSQIINTRKKLKQKGPSAGPLSKISLEESFRQDSMEYTELASGILVPHSQTLKEKSEICKSLLGHFIFNSLSLKSINLMAADFKLYYSETDSVVFAQNSIGKNFYIIDSGKVEVLVNGSQKTVLKKGEFFGEIGLLHDTLRTATVKTLEACTF